MDHIFFTLVYSVFVCNSRTREFGVFPNPEKEMAFPVAQSQEDTSRKQIIVDKISSIFLSITINVVYNAIIL